MNKEFHYFIKIIKCVLHNQSVPIEEGISYKELFKFAQSHNLESFLYYGLIKNEYFNKEENIKFYKAVTQAYKDTVLKTAFQSAETEVLLKELEKNDIKYMPLKGYIIKGLYPYVELRTMADFDCLFDKKEAKKVKKIMLSLGYEIEHFNASNHDVYFKKPFMNVEMHRELVNDSYKISKYYKNIWQHLNVASGFKYQYEMTKEDFFIFMIVHCAKHFTSGGTGVRSFIDIYLYVNGYQDMNWDYINNELNNMGLLKFCQTSIDLGNYWFGDGEATLLLNSFEESIFSSGVYGTVQNNATINMFMNENAINNLENSKTKYIFKRIFPSFQFMKTRNPILNKMPILLPWFYFTRILGGFFHFKRSKFEMHSVNAITKEKYDKLNNLHEDLNVKGKI